MTLALCACVFLTLIMFTYFPLFKIFLIEHHVYLVRQSRMIKKGFYVFVIQY